MAINNVEFDYKRNDDFQEPEETPGIRSFEVHGELKDITQDPEWMKTRLYALYSDVEPLLNSLSERSQGVSRLQLDDYRPEIQEQRRIAHIREPFERILSLIQRERGRSKQAVKNLQERILNESEQERPVDIADRFSQDTLNAEIRMLLRAQEMSARIKTVKDSLENDDPSFLIACISAPDEIIPKDKLQKIRREFAFSKNPTLRDAENDAKELEAAVSRRTSQISGTATKILLNNGQDMPMSKAEFFEYFPAKNELEQARQQRLTNSEADLKRRKEQQIDFDEQSIGVSL